MKKSTLLTSMIIVLLLVFLGCDKGVKVTSDLDKLVPKSSFIFSGKVIAMHATLTEEDSVSNLGVVEVLRIIDAPEDLKSYEKQQVTVKFLKPETIKEGSEMLFYTEPYWYGESLGVEEVASYLPESAMFKTADLQQKIGVQRQKLQDMNIKDLLKTSDLVVSGKVLKISDVPQEEMLTEHNPEWKIADIEVGEILKGSTNDKVVKVVFASGKDVAWYNSPKLAVGDDGVFMVQPPEKTLPKNLRENRVLLTPGTQMKGLDNISKIKELLK